jgi:hypothetical protein
LLSFAGIGSPLRASAGTIDSLQSAASASHTADACPPDCGLTGFGVASPPINDLIGTDLQLIAMPLPSTWTMMLLGLGMAFAAYRLFSMPD